MKRMLPPIKFVASLATAFLALTAATQTIASSLTNGLVAYWPMDNATGCNNKTPEVVHGYDMQVIYGSGGSTGFFLTNFNPNLYLTNDAHRGNAVYVNNDANNGGGVKQMALASRSPRRWRTLAFATACR